MNMQKSISGRYWGASGKTFLALALGVVVLLAGWWLLRPDPRVQALNAALEAVPALSDYPYPFRVLSVDGPVAVLSTPRSADMPAYRVLWAIDPSLRQAGLDSPAYQSAQQKLSDVQKLARKTVEAQPGIKQIHWKLDMDWLAQHVQSPQD